MGGRRRTFKLYLPPFSRYLALKVLKMSKNEVSGCLFALQKGIAGLGFENDILVWVLTNRLPAWGGARAKVGFFEVVTPLGGMRVFICVSDSCFGSHAFVFRPIWSNQSFTDSQMSESCFGSHAFVSRSIWSNQSFTDSQNYALFGDIRFFAEK
eukprot:sb/3473306/